MKRLATLIAVSALTLGSLIPVASATETSISFSGRGEAKALDLAIPALQRLIPAGTGQDRVDQIRNFDGLTLGLTSSKFSTLPLAASGAAMGVCDLTGNGADPLALPDPAKFCTSTTVKTSDTAAGKAGDPNLGCQNTVALVVTIDSACARSTSSVASGLSSINEAGVTEVKVDLDLSILGTKAIKDNAITTLQGFVNDFLFLVKVSDPTITQKQNDLKDALDSYLAALKDTGKAADIKAGASHTTLSTAGTVTSITSQAAASTIGFLGISDPLTDGLVLINSSSADATVNIDKSTGVASGSAVPALVNMKVKDLLKVCGSQASLQCDNGYITAANIKKEDLDPLLGQLNTLELLSTSITVGQPEVIVSPDHHSASASIAGVEIHALKGLGASTKSDGSNAKDGGFDLRLAAAHVEAASTEVAGACIGCASKPMPHTGGPVYVLFAAGVLMSSLSILLIRFARKIVAVR
ncbi:MAG: hypothetical protein ABR507_07720 [Actinomycetota bacterium]|nr:hypothetical protein [Actinomycetota bacterium]